MRHAGAGGRRDVDAQPQYAIRWRVLLLSGYAKAADRIARRVLALAERSVYFLAAVALIAAAGGLFVVLVIDVLSSDTGDISQTVVTVLERMLLVFILLELAHSVHVVLRERTLVAEPFSRHRTHRGRPADPHQHR